MINELRNEIENVDLKIQKLFKERLEIVRKIAAFKKENNLEIEDMTRELSYVKKLLAIYNDKSTEENYEEFMHAIFDISKKVQKNEKICTNRK